jgi:hypothetical protein
MLNPDGVILGNYRTGLAGKKKKKKKLFFNKIKIKYLNKIRKKF